MAVKKKLLFYLLQIASLAAFAQAPSNDNCNGAIPIIDAQDFCSNAGQYTNVNATPSFTGSGQDVWFAFTARNYEVRITITGAGLKSSQIALYGSCTAPIPGTTLQDGNTTIFNNSGLIPGQPYFFTVSSTTGNAGAFQICIENYQSTVKPGQDFTGATLICSTETTIKEINVTGLGMNPDEAAGTCLDVRPDKEKAEKNSAWYKWTAANSGTLVFTLNPNQVNDLDWILYELGPEGNSQNPSVANKIRCAAGSGIGGTDCPQSAQEPPYTLTGLDFNETDEEEASCSGKGQNGVLKAVTMKAGYVYALYVNNYTEGNNAFELTFKDRSGKAGTGLFKGPSGKIHQIVNSPCTIQQSYTFSTDAKDFDAIKWYFGEGASVTEWDGLTPPANISYSTPGSKTVLMELKNNIGCSVVETQTFIVGVLPDPPLVTINKPTLCVNETLQLSTAEQAGVTYKWTGPNGFTSNERQPNILITSTAMAGKYTLILSRGDCSTAAVSTEINSIYDQPIVAFRAEPKIPSKLAFPAAVKFYNDSQGADSYLWDFGDGTPTSTEVNPEHTYTGRGNFSIKLTAFNNGCAVSITHGTLMVGEPGAIFIPNTFTPNNDAINDEFVVNMNNIKTYRIQIFNRYGIRMYSSEDVVQNWNGTYQNEPVPVGTYYYVVDAIDLDNNVIKQSGSVTVLR